MQLLNCTEASLRLSKKVLFPPLATPHSTPAHPTLPYSPDIPLRTQKTKFLGRRRKWYASVGFLFVSLLNKKQFFFHKRVTVEYAVMKSWALRAGNKNLAWTSTRGRLFQRHWLSFCLFLQRQPRRGWISIHYPVPHNLFCRVCIPQQSKRPIVKGWSLGTLQLNCGVFLFQGHEWRGPCVRRQQQSLGLHSSADGGLPEAASLRYPHSAGSPWWPVEERARYKRHGGAGPIKGLGWPLSAGEWKFIGVSIGVLFL